MRQRLTQFLVAELFAFGALVTGGLASFGAWLTLGGVSRHPAALSWGLVALFSAAALVLGRTAVVRMRRVFARAR